MIQFLYQSLVQNVESEDTFSVLSVNLSGCKVLYYCFRQCIHLLTSQNFTKTYLEYTMDSLFILIIGMFFTFFCGHRSHTHLILHNALLATMLSTMVSFLTSNSRCNKKLKYIYQKIVLVINNLFKRFPLSVFIPMLSVS